ncbi:unnamed protein product [Brachionus calyciflorus]|uniref:Codanin-1 C-terminal domain-containing protein n=1 Tax=Brachionus calyciflorus TaxID=104777 RepID=A0A813MH51_9BILA|nr:unnamed protein product [Brachionus calyciflorus]
MIMKDKYDLIIENLTNKVITCDELIDHLKNNRFKSNNESKISLNDVTDELNLKCQIKENEKSILDKKINRNFVSYFLTLIHEEGNKYLPTKNVPANSSNSLSEKLLSNENFSTPNNLKIVSLNKSSNMENIFDSTLSNSNTPQSNFKSKKIVLQPLPSNSPRNSGANSPVDYTNSSFSKSNSFKRHNTFAGSSNSSPVPGIFSPRNQQNNTPTYSSKLNNKATLFDFITTPKQSPVHQKQSDAQNLISDFKNRFMQHQNQMQNQQQLNNKMPKTPQNSQIIEPNVDSPFLQKDDYPDLNQVNEIKQIEESSKKDYSKLGELVKNNLKANDLLKISILSNFYTQLILKNNKIKLFSSIESCIFFAIKSISNLECILKHLKNSTLTELKENIYMKSFSEYFQNFSLIVNNELSKEEIKQKSKLVFFDLKVIPFNADTNTRCNFQDKQAFLSSKNQRDAFYDILWNWEKNHSLENWNFSDYYGDKIRNLVSCRDNLSNFFEFVKLFLAQLVLMCKDDKMLIDNKTEDPGEQIKGLNDPIKLKRLNARMSTPNPHYGPNPAPKFIGYQEFFKDFIDISNSPRFHQCLKECISNEIENIHKDIPDFENKADDSFEKDTFEDMLLKLKILGKFLGYLVFYPYQYPVASYCIKDLVLIRNNQLMPINIQSYLERALAKKHLILTVPCIVEFLSMMDENAYFIDNIQQTFNFLIMIYNSKLLMIKSKDFTIDKLLLLFNVAWLLQLKKISANQIKIKENLSDDDTKIGLDNFSFVTPLLLHFCCPYLDELQKLLTRFSTGVKKAGQKIKDVSHLFSLELIKDQPNIKLDNKQIQLKLMTQFLSLHPAQKRLVDFISENVFISFIKYYRQNNLKNQLNELNEEFNSIDSEKQADLVELESILQNMAKNFSKKICTECLAAGKEFLKPKIETLISNSLDKTSSNQMIKATSQITLYKSIDKLSQWININLNDKIFYDELKLKKIKKKVDSNEIKTIQNNPDLPIIDTDSVVFNSECLMPSEIFSKIKAIQKRIYKTDSKSFEIQLEIEIVLKDILDFCIKNVQESKLIKSIKSYLAQVSSEIIFVFIIRYPELSISVNIVKLYVEIEKTLDQFANQLILERFISPRNKYILEKLGNSVIFKSNLKRFIGELIHGLNLGHEKFDEILQML